MRSRLCALYLLLAATPALAQTPEDIKKAAEARAAVAAADKAEADARKAAADARKAEADAEMATMGALDLTKVRGSGLTIKDDTGRSYIEANVLAYSAVNNIAQSIVEAVTQAAHASRVVLLSAADTNMLRELGPYEFQVRQLVKSGSSLNKSPASSFEKLDECPKGAVPLGVPVLGAAQAALQLLSLFSTETTYAGMAVTKTEMGLHAAILGVGKDKIYSGSSVVPSFSAAPGGTSLTLDQRRPLLVSFAELSGITDEIRTKQPAYDRLITVLTKKAASPAFAACKDEVVRDKVTLEQSLAAQNAYLKSVGDMFARLLKMDDASGTKLLDGLLRAEYLLDKKVLVLEAQIIEAAGTTVARKKFFGGSARFTGGAVVWYRLANTDGEVLAAGTLRGYLPEARTDEIASK